LSYFSYDGFDFSDLVDYFVVEQGSNPYADAPVQHVMTPLQGQGGGVLTLRPDGPRLMTFAGQLRSGMLDGPTFIQQRDKLAAAFRPSRRRLLSAPSADRFSVATCMGLVTATEMAAPAWSATFVAEDPYEQSLAPSAGYVSQGLVATGDPQTWVAVWYLPNGGTAPAPLRHLILVTAGGAQTLSLRAFDTGEAVALPSSLAVGDLVTFDVGRGAWVAPMAGCVGYWPLVDGSGPLHDFSGNARELTVTGSPTLLADGYLDRPGVAFPGSAGSYLEQTNAAFSLGTFSAAAWVKPTTTADAYVFGRSAANTGWALTAHGGLWTFSLGTGSAAVLLQVNSLLVPGRWWFLAATYAAGLMSVYVGSEFTEPQLIQHGQPAAYSAGAGPLRIGAGTDVDGTARTLAGTVAEPAVWSSALSLDQLVRVWRDGPPAATARAVPWLGSIPLHFPPRVIGPNLSTDRYALSLTATAAPGVRWGSMWRNRWH